MGLSPTRAAAAALARPRSSSSRFVSTTCAAGKLQGEAQRERRRTTEDGMVVREVLRFDKTWPRTSRSSNLIKPKVPTPLETNLDLESDSVAVPRAPSAPRRCARQRLQPWLPQTTTSLISAASKAFSLRKSRSCLRAATTAGGVEARRGSRACRAMRR